MNEFVKKFIENTSYLINMNMWPAFFYEWYRECAKIWPATVEEAELFAILKLAELPVDWNARKQIIVEATIHSISTVLTNLDAWYGDNISISYLADELTTRLGLDNFDIEECIDTAAKRFNLKMTSDNTGYRIPGR